MNAKCFYFNVSVKVSMFYLFGFGKLYLISLKSWNNISEHTEPICQKGFDKTSIHFSHRTSAPVLRRRCDNFFWTRSRNLVTTSSQRVQNFVVWGIQKASQKVPRASKGSQGRVPKLVLPKNRIPEDTFWTPWFSMNVPRNSVQNGPITVHYTWDPLRLNCYIWSGYTFPQGDFVA